MSNNADCVFTEKKNGWYYKIQQYPFGETTDYDKHGPFPSFDKAERHLDNNYLNPGGYSINELT